MYLIGYSLIKICGNLGNAVFISFLAPNLWESVWEMKMWKGGNAGIRNLCQLNPVCQSDFFIFAFISDSNFDSFFFVLHEL